MIVMIDNYDSFTYNLVQCFGLFGAELHVVRNDQFTLDELEKLKPQGIVISPGPGHPDGAGLSLGVIERFAQRVPILGVCLGHQCIGQFFGGKIVRAPMPVHGKTSTIHHDGNGLYRHLPNPFNATRYHSLAVDESTLPKELEVTSRTEEGIIMGIRHRKLPIEGVQYHPESVLTPEGPNLLKNFLEQTKKAAV